MELPNGLSFLMKKAFGKKKRYIMCYGNDIMTMTESKAQF